MARRTNHLKLPSLFVKMISGRLQLQRIRPLDRGPGPPMRQLEASIVVDCGHSYCFGRSRSGGPLRGFGTGLPIGRTEFPIGRSAVRTTVGKVRTTIKKVRYPTGKVPGQIMPKSPSMGASVPFYTGRVRLSFRTVRIRPDT